MGYVCSFACVCVLCVYVCVRVCMSVYACYACVGLARSIYVLYIRCIYGIFRKKIIKFTVIYGGHIYTVLADPSYVRVCMCVCVCVRMCVCVRVRVVAFKRVRTFFGA